MPKYGILFDLRKTNQLWSNIPEYGLLFHFEKTHQSWSNNWNMVYYWTLVYYWTVVRKNYSMWNIPDCRFLDLGKIEYT